MKCLVLLVIAALTANQATTASTATGSSFTGTSDHAATDETIADTLSKLVAENQQLRDQFSEFKKTVKEELAVTTNELKSHRKERRSLDDITTVERIAPVRNFISGADEAAGINNPDNIPTTAAHDWTFFKLSNSNSQTLVSPLGIQVQRSECLAPATYEKCVNTDCTAKSKTNVPQQVLSWHVMEQRWMESGPGATGARSGPNFPVDFKPIVANGVKAIAHFSPDGVNDFLIPASFDEDVVAANANEVVEPTRQCGSVWIYDKFSLSWRTYQDCAWKGSGTTDVHPFKIYGEQYLIHTSMVSRKYKNQELVEEKYNGLSNFIVKWSPRTTGNDNASYPLGHFLSGGEDDQGTFSSSHPQANPTVGNNGANVWQVFEGLSGVSDVETFEINGQIYAAFSEHVDNTNCGSDGLASKSEMIPSCQNVELDSHIFVYNDRLPNPRGDCSATFSEDCTHFRGEFEVLQTIPTSGAKSMHFFSVATTGSIAYFLAVAEHRNNDGEPVSSSIWKWNGRKFGLFQRFETSYAEKFQSFTDNGQVFLIVSNRGCPDMSSVDPSIHCASDSVHNSRSRLMHYDAFKDIFVMLDESESTGHFHPYGADFNIADGDRAMQGVTALPTGIATFQLPTWEFIRVGAPVTYVAIANARVTDNEVIGTCPSDNKAECSHPPSIFTVDTAVSEGLSSLVEKLTATVKDNDEYLADLNFQLSGELISHVVRDLNTDMKMFAARSVDSFTIDGSQYVVIGFTESLMTREECVNTYTNENGTPTECPHLNGLPVATKAQCESTCTESETTPAFLKNHKTSTALYKVQSSSTQQPELVKIQDIPSLGVSHVHFFYQTAPVQQSEYDACATDADGSTPCFNETPQAPEIPVLAIVNAFSTCEYDYVSNTPNIADPRRGVDLLRWDTETESFQKFTQITTECPITNVKDFSVKCQAKEGVSLSQPACASYLAVVEDCASQVSIPTPDNVGEFKVSFHKWDNAIATYRHCQPYADPGDPRNQAESPCRQQTDTVRVIEGLPHSFDFPDLLPASLRVGIDITNDNSGYQPQLKGANIKAIEFVTPQAKKKVFYFSDKDSESATPVEDDDQEEDTLYFHNGRKNFELVASVVYNSNTAAPQIFGLEAVATATAQCSGHPTTPTRRQFEFIQDLPETAGGLDATSFKRTTLGGTEKLFTIFPEKHNRVQFGSSFLGGQVSSVYVNEVCDEYTPHEYDESILSGGLFEPVDPTAPEKVFCPYSANEEHFEAWEAFRNHYNPVSSCKGKYANYESPFSHTIEQPYYNSFPPPSLQSKDSTLSPKDQYVYARKEPVAVDTHFYTKEDYTYLHDRRNDVFTKYQDLPTFQANTVAVHEVCGQNGQLWVVFGNDGWDIQRDDSYRPLPNQLNPPRQKKLVYVWNDRFAVADNMMDCTAEAARNLIAKVGSDNARLGCFEHKELAIPVNSGATYGVTMFQTGDYLLALSLNFAEGRTGNAVETEKNTQTALQMNPDLCNDSVDWDGVRSPIFVVDVSKYGGLQCRQNFATTASVSSSNTIEEFDMDALKTTFVTLEGDQTISGAKQFTNPVTQFSSIVSSGGITVEGESNFKKDVTVGNLHTLGLVDNVDVDNFYSTFTSFESQTASAIMQLQASKCAFTGDSNACVAVAKKTSCFPQSSLTEAGKSGLYASFMSYMQALYSDVTISDVQATTNNDIFMFIIQDTESNIARTTERVDASNFFDPMFCKASALPEPVEGQTQLDRTATFVNIPCEMFDLQHVDEFRIAFAAGFASLGVRATDVVVVDIRCPATTITFYVSVPTALAFDMDQALEEASRWELIYSKLNTISPIMFSDKLESLEYATGLFVPSAGGDGGDGGSQGSGTNPVTAGSQNSI